MNYTKVVVLLLSLVVSSVLASAAPQRRRTPRQAAKPAESASARWLPALRSRADFDRLARVYTDQPYALPHVIFVIDRRDGNKIYYADSKRYRFHVDFVNGNYLSLERGDVFFKNNYVSENRRFILGTLAW